MAEPGYQDILDGQIPAVSLPEGAGSLRVIAGEFGDAKGPARTFTPVNLWDVKLGAGKTACLELPEGHSVQLLILRGKVALNGGESAGSAMLASFGRPGTGLSLHAQDEARVLVMSGEPIEEPVVGYGPFVMNSEAEIDRAIEDYRSGKMGHLD